LDLAQNELALVLGGGGARAAYQVGFLRHLAERYPNLRAPILTGVSAGGINAAHLANSTGSFTDSVERLTKLWCGISVEQIFRVDSISLLGHMFRWFAQITVLGSRRGVPQVRGLVDTDPLSDFLHRGFESEDGALPGIEQNLAEGNLRAIALTTTKYSTGQTVTWFQGRTIEAWERPQRISIGRALRVEHVMASASLPILFPAVQIDGDWYGDGGIRLHSPLAPAVHLGAGRMIAVSARHGRSREEADRPVVPAYPPPIQVLGVLYNSIFLDLLDQDAIHLERINQLTRDRAKQHPSDLREVELLVLRPSQDLAVLARDYEPRLPRLFRQLTRRLGSRESLSPDLLSIIMFQADYIERMIDLGLADADERADEIARIIES
jgi:NTE family protein